ncbi:MAG: IclR family transcriptional regulator [Acidimicrobiia bacterium]|nr:IclR family transcriptional regulator [Acidimicrobiia bacterium]MYB78537.1 IclR family transcriptional regulator [Acidimicrobiia bacterium]MYH05511.1 IclR family transcriptional regulator [Acidimicrobiia bacterium]MYJ16395.1 IclR family transcriptional regulator [Acidimicrobiia bacterium]MYK55010.1 IclR family transcriptional regulator [Acidimicrobiia bacterium]
MTAVPSQQRGSLSKGLRILAVFDEKSPALSVAEIARRTQISRASVYRLAGALEELGYISRTERLYRPSKKVLMLGVAAVESREFVEHIRPYLDEISLALPDATAVNYGVLEGAEVIYMARRHRDDIITINLQVGSRLPAHLSSLGKAILSAMPPREAEGVLRTMDFQPRTTTTVTGADDYRAQLEEARIKGIALNDQELTVGLRSVSAPVFHGAEVIGAVGVATLATRADIETLEDHYGPILKSFVERISGEISAIRLDNRVPIYG